MLAESGRRSFLPPFSRLQSDRGSAGNPPVFLGVERRSAVTAVRMGLAGPENCPLGIFRGGQQRLRRGIEVQIWAEIHDQEAVASRFAEVAENEGFRAKYCPV